MFAVERLKESFQHHSSEFLNEEVFKTVQIACKEMARVLKLYVFVKCL